MKEYIIPFADDADIEKLEQIHGTNGELIRCKDCKYNPNNPCLYADDDVIEGYIHCGHLGKDGYCSLAKRKEE